MKPYYTLIDVQKRTGLSVPTLRKQLAVCRAILAPFIKKGSRNKLLFDSNALIIFDKVKQLREEGMSLNQIKKELDIEFNKVINQDSNSKNEMNKQLAPEMKLFVELQEKFNKEIKNANERVLELEKTNSILKEQIKLLTDGKSPEERLYDFKVQAEKERTLEILFSKLESSDGLNPISYLKRRQIYREIKKLKTF